jgi:hypothetical protein
MLRTLVLYITYGLLLSIVCATNKANAQNFEWLRLMRGPSSMVDIRDVCTDNYNNVYITGEFTGTILHPTTNVTLLTNLGIRDGFIAKFTSSGSLIWIKQLSGSGLIRPNAIQVDNYNKVYLTGAFKDTAVFSTASPQFTLVDSQYTAFLAKYDSAGNINWVCNVANETAQSGSEGYSILCEDSLIILSGWAYDTCNFQYNGSTPQKKLRNIYYYFVSLLDSGGTPLMNRFLDGSEDMAHIEVHRDDAKNFYISTMYGALIDADPGLGIVNYVVGSAQDNGLAIKLDPQGNYLWSKDWGSISYDECRAAAWTGNSLLTVGAVRNYAALVKTNGDTIKLIPTASLVRNSYIISIDANGDYQWAYLMHGGSNTISDIHTLANGDFIVSGRYRDSVDVGLGTATLWLKPSNIGSSGGSGIFAAKYDMQQNLLWVKQVADTNLFNFTGGHQIDAAGNVIICGQYAGTDSSDFDPGLATYKRKPLAIDGYLLKLGNCSTSSSTLPIHACDKFRSPQNNIYDSAGIYLESYYNIANCDSMVTYIVQVDTTVRVVDSVERCGSYTSPAGNTYLTSGIYRDTLVASSGCDSIIFTVLTIDTLTAQATNNGQNLLQASTNGASYQWLNCLTNTIVPGANAATYAANGSGSYAVIVSSGTCVDTSACVETYPTSLTESSSLQFSIAPNPAKNLVYLSNTSNINANCEIVNVLGQTLIKTNCKSHTTQAIDISSLALGVYSVIVKVGKEQQLIHLSVQ